MHNSRDRARDISEDIRNGRIDAKVNETLPHCRCLSLSLSLSPSVSCKRLPTSIIVTARRAALH